MNKEKRKKLLLNKEAKISIISVIILLIVYVIFAVALFTRQDILSYISASLLFIALLWNMMRPLTKKGRIGISDWIDMGFSFIPTVILLVIFIAILPDEVKTVMTAIVASTISGLLTLFGVALTIKYNRIEKEEDEIKKIKPYIFPACDDTWGAIPEEKKVEIKLVVNHLCTEIKSANTNSEFNYQFAPIKIVNSDLSMCTIFGMIINKQYVFFEYSQVILKNSYLSFRIHWIFQLDNKIDSISLLLEDMLHNPYEAKVGFSVTQHSQDVFKEIIINSVSDIVPFKPE